MTDTVTDYLDRAKAALDQGLPMVAMQQIIDGVRIALDGVIVAAEARTTPRDKADNCPACGGSGHRSDFVQGQELLKRRAAEAEGIAARALKRAEDAELEARNAKVTIAGLEQRIVGDYRAQGHETLPG